MMNTTPLPFVARILCISMISVAAKAEPLTPPSSLMCTPGELIFSEDFEPDTVSDRWGFKANFALRDGALLRTNVSPEETQRVFLKDASFHNAIIQFDFKLTGQTTELRLVTGSGGHYNSVTEIHSEYFQVNTPVDRAAGIVPAHLGECVSEPWPNQWQTMTVEYFDDEIVSHVSNKEFVLGKHPIIDRTRTYFAFQFDLPGASIDNVRIWQAIGRRDEWDKLREQLAVEQAGRELVKRDPRERYKIAYTNLKSRLTLNDPAYRDLVAKHTKLEAALHSDYSEAFTSHKELGKLIAKKKQKLKATDPEFKRMEVAVHKASKAEDAYVLSTQPEIARFKAEGAPKQRYTSELGQVRAQLEAAGDKQLAVLVAKTAQHQTALEARFPEAFESVDSAVDRRQTKRKLLNTDPEFQARNRAVVEAGRAIKVYEHRAFPGLAQLEADSKAWSDSLKTPNVKSSR